MNYFYCSDCQSFMDENEALCWTPEVHTELDDKPTEWVSHLRCIYCGSDNLEDACECDHCGELFIRTMLDDNWLCEDCRKEIEDGSEAE